MPPMPAFYIAEHTALDLLNSICAPAGTDIDWLEDGEALVSWMVGAGMFEPQVGEEIVSSISSDDLDGAAEHARMLREDFRRVTDLLESSEEETVSSDDLAFLNRWLEVPLAGRPFIPTDGSGFTRSPLCVPQTGDQLVRLLADRIADYLSETDLAQLRQCEGPTCTLYFRDTTKNRSRRWCSMAVCGNRAKAARFRKQKSQSAQD